MKYRSKSQVGLDDEKYVSALSETFSTQLQSVTGVLPVYLYLGSK